MQTSLLISVVDDDVSIRESLPELLSALGFATAVFESAQQFLASASLDRTDCLIVDVAMPGMTGPELQAELLRRQKKIPMIFITAHADELLRLQLLDQGAVACLLKPFSEAALVDAISRALGIAL